MHMKLKGASIIVTGGSGGLGRLLCNRLRREGADIAVLDRAPPHGGERYIAADLSSSEGVIAACNAVSAVDPDVLINLAGIQFFGALEDQPEQSALLTYMVNLTAPALLTRAILPGLKRKNAGMIVNVGSAFGSIPFAHFATYSSSKAGLKALSEALRRELSHTGIRVTYVAPRAIQTPLNGPDVLRLAAATGMNMDPPDTVASEIVAAMKADKADVHIGFPESLFARVNAVAPRLVDRALAKNDAVARRILSTSQS